MDLFGKSDPYCIFLLASGHGRGKTYREVHRTEVQEHTLNPQWNCFVQPIFAFCENDYDRRIRVKMFDWDRGTNDHDFIGQFDMTVRMLLSPKAKFRVINLEKQRTLGDKYKHSGSVTFKVAQHFSMLHDVDREADASHVRHRPAGYREAEIEKTPQQRKAFLAFMAGGQALVKAQAMVRMATGLALHKTAEELSEETHRMRSAQQSQEQRQQALQRMTTNMQMFARKQQAEETLSLQVRGEGLPKMDTFGLSDPFLEFYKIKQAGSSDTGSDGAASAAAASSSGIMSPSSSRRSSAATSSATASHGPPSLPVDGWELFAKSEVVKSTLNPKWPPMLIKAAAFFAEGAAGVAAEAAAAAAASADAAAGSPTASVSSPGTSPTASARTLSSTSVLIRCFDWNSSGTMELIGECQSDYAQLRRARDLRLDLLATEKDGKVKKRGALILEFCRAVQTRTEEKDISATRHSLARKSKRQSVASLAGLKL
jgi:hypothetical protein